jgi:hypothetical protein
MSASQWEWGAFRISTPDGPRHQIGWMWKSWGINSRPRKGPFRLIHIPTGFKAFEVPSLRAAKCLAEELENLTDWETITTGNLAERLPDRTAAFHLYTVAMRKAGYRLKPKFGVLDGGRL